MLKNIGFYPHPEDRGLWRLFAFFVNDEFETISDWLGFEEDSDYDDWESEADELDALAQNPLREGK